MKEIKITVTNPTGLHTRPGTEFVRLAKKFESNIVIKKSDKVADGKSLVKVLKLGISQGSEIVITTDGEDEEKALDTLCQYIKNLTE